MSLGVIDLLEVIEVDEDHAEFITEPSRAVDLGFQRLREMPRVEQAGAIVRDGEFLNLLHGLRVFDGEGIDDGGAWPERGGVRVVALVVERGVAREVGLGGIEPPGVNAFAEQLPFDLRPEQLSRGGIEGIVEGVPEADPVLDFFLQVAFVEEARGV